MIQKWSFVMYVVSSVALGYAILVNSPLRFTQKAWANTETPLSFFGIAIVLIIHIVVSGKFYTQEKFKKVIWHSVVILALAALLLIPNVLDLPNMVFFYVSSYFPQE